MDKKVFYRGKIGTYWYNFTESLAYALTYKPTPDNLIYTKRIPYGEDRRFFRAMVRSGCARKNGQKTGLLKSIFNRPRKSTGKPVLFLLHACMFVYLY